MKTCQSCGACFDDGLDLCSYDGELLVDAFAGPRVLGARYLLEQRLAAGAMGVVFRATHLQVGSTVAVKVMQPRADSLRVGVARFHREAQVLGQIKHPNAVMVMDFGVEHRGAGPVPYLVTEFLRGESLEELLSRQPSLDLAATERIITPVCDALEEAHLKGVVHRDLKPSNLFLEKLRDGTQVVKVLDFGIAKFVVRKADSPSLEESGPLPIPDFARPPLSPSGAVETVEVPRPVPLAPDATPSTGDITQAGFMVGTLSYMAPEQIQGGPISPRTDLYALASLVYRLLTGRVPFVGKDVDVINAKLSDRRPSLAEAGVTAPPELDECLRACLAQEASERPDTVRVLARAVQQAAARGAGASGGAETLEEGLETAARILGRLALTAQQWNVSGDQEEQYGTARDRILALDATISGLEQVVAALPEEGTVFSPRVRELAQGLDDGVARAGMALRELHGLRATAPETVDYLAALWRRLGAGASRLSKELQRRLAGQRRNNTARINISGLFGGATPQLEAVLEKLGRSLVSNDPLESADAMEESLRLHGHALVAYLARGNLAADPLAELLVTGLWRHADALLLRELFPEQRPTPLLPVLASLPHLEVARPFALLAQVFSLPADAPDIVKDVEQAVLAVPAFQHAPELWRCLLLHPSVVLRGAAAGRLGLTDFWTVVAHPRTPVAVLGTVFDRALQDATPEYLKVFFLCVRDSLQAATDAEELPAAFMLLRRFFTVPCFHEDVVFEPLLHLERTLRSRAQSLGVQPTGDEAFLESVAAFTADGVVESRPPKEMRNVPLPIQRRLAREGHFLHYFVSHANERVARETLPHLLRMEDIVRFLRIPTLHRVVLVELAKNRRFFRQEAARLALLQNPHTPAHVAREYVPVLSHEQLRLLATNRHIGADVRGVAASYLERVERRKS